MYEQINLAPSRGVSTVIRPDRCEKCKFAMPVPKASDLLECRANPPQVMFLPAKLPTGQMVPQDFTVFPKVQKLQWCGAFRPPLNV
jgi:hypothetical protein